MPIATTATIVRSGATVPALVAAVGERASIRFLEFFAANIRNPHTRRAYYRAAEEFLAWCASVGVPSIVAIQPVHVATWIEAATHKLAAPSVKQRLAALYSFARICAALGMAVEDVYTQNRRLWVRLREKGGKQHAMPCYHNLDEYLVAYLDGAALRGDPKGPLFRTIGRGTGQLTRTPLPAGERLCDDPPARGGGRHRNQARQSQLPGHRDHGLSQERRHARKGRGDGKPRLNAHDAALSSPARRVQPRRGRADCDLKSKGKSR
jgi:integrase